MAIRFGMTIADMIRQLTKGFRSVAGRDPDGLEKIKIQQEAVQRFKDMNKVVDMQGRTLDPTKPIMGGTQEGAALKSGIMKATGAKPKKIDPEDMAQGGRAGFKDGMSRRKFMQIMGGLAALPIVGKFFKAGKVAAPTVEKVIEKVSTSDVPPYFLNLVNKIKNLGQKFDGPKERSESFTYKDYEMDIDYDTGAIEIKKTKESMIPGGDEAGISEEVYMTYKPGMADETTKGKKVVDEYEEFTARPDIDGKMKDVDEGVPDEVIEEGTMFEDNMTEFGKASGGIARMLGE